MPIAWICAVDSSASRWGLIADLAVRAGIAIVPLEKAPEYDDRPGAVLVRDSGDAVARVAGTLERAACWPPIFGYRARPAPAAVVDALAAGATDYFAWPPDLTAIALRVDQQADRLAQRRDRFAAALHARRAVDALTPRERETLVHITSGESTKEIARNLGISPRTIEIHRANMRNRLGVASSAEAVALAQRAGLINDA